VQASSQQSAKGVIPSPSAADDPEEAGGTPAGQAVKLGGGVKTSWETLDVSECPLVAFVTGALEVDAMIFLEERVAVGDRRVMDEKVPPRSGLGGH